MAVKRVLLSTTPTATTSTYFTEKLRAFYPEQIAKDEDGNLLIAVETVQPYNPINGQTEMPCRIIPASGAFNTTYDATADTSARTYTVPVGKIWKVLYIAATITTNKETKR